MKTKQKKSEQIDAGTTLLTAKPFVYVLKSKLRTERCDNCFGSGKLLKCSGCQYVFYCNRACQKESWPIHKPECPNLRRVAPRIVPDAARIMARLILKLQKGGDREQGYYSKTGFRKFKDLMSHYTDIKQDQQRMEHFSSLCAVLFEFLGDIVLPNSAELMGIYGRLIINGFNILDPEMISIGTGIYLGVSIIDHSCQPNAVAVFEGTTIFIRSLVTMPSLDLSKVFISYIDLLNSPSERREELKANYYFFCQCPKCIDEEQVKVINSASCPNSSCTEPVDLSGENVTSCPSCEAKISNEFIEEFLDVNDFTRIQLQNMNQTDMAYLDVCKVSLKRIHGFLHPLNLYHIKMLDAAFDSSIEMGQWQDAKTFGMQLIPGYKYYFGDMHPILGILYLKLGKILVYENLSGDALPYLHLAKSVLHVTHGATHSLCREQLAPLLQ